MHIYTKILAVALAAAFIAGTTASEAQGQIRKKKDILKENAELKGRLDSMFMELVSYKKALEDADSINSSIMHIMSATEEEDSTNKYSFDYTAEHTSDSLLNIWYTQRKAGEEVLEGYDMDTIKFQSNVSDQVYIERIKNMNSFITLPYNEIVRNYIILYSEKMSNMENILGLCSYYMPIFEEILDRHGMPQELKAMAVIESALNPVAVSRAGAKGMWQFMYSTAKMYGLQIDSFIDERLDPVKSAEAAARYLQDAYKIFGDWNLAIASYNCGAGNVNKAIRRSGSRAFWDIWPYLPRETRGYVPAFVGALYTMTYYKEHGIKPSAIEMPAHTDTFKINRMLHLRQVSELTEAPLEELKNLNPQYRHEIIPGNGKEYILRIPYNYTNAFIDNEDSLYIHKADIYFNPVTLKKIQDGGDGERILYKVKSGDYLGKIASMYRVSVSQIKRWNNLKSNNIRIGQRLTIYRGGNAPSTVSSSSGTASSSATKSPAPTVTDKGEYLIYTVRNGDSFYTIAQNYPGVSAKNIMDFNGLSSAKIRPGMQIKIPKL